jgi:hypothetical protein
MSKTGPLTAAMRSLPKTKLKKGQRVKLGPVPGVYATVIRITAEGRCAVLSSGDWMCG